MDYKTAQAVLTIYVHEKQLEAAVHKYFQYSEEGKIRRGIVADKIAAEIGTNKNQTFFKRLRKVMVARDHREIRVDGCNYWSNLAPRPTVSDTDVT